VNIFAIRKATLLDAEAIARLATELGYPSSAAQVHARLQGLLLSSEHRVLVACDALNIVVGWVHTFLSYSVESDPYAEIAGLVVSSEYRNNGLGSMLLAGIEEWLRKSGIKNLRVRSRIERKEARSFYQKKGFSISKQQNIFDKTLR
jgi:GNAT superfamily N-acetyltransferase